MEAVKQFTVEKDGFYGFLHTPDHDGFPGKAIIVVGGSEGNDNIPLSVGAMFAEAGISGKERMASKSFAEASSFTWRDKPIAYAPGGRISKAGIVFRFITEQQMDMCREYERVLKNAPKEAEIAVENIGGPVLLICASDDRRWPSAAACRAVEYRLKEHDYLYPVKRMEYEHACHITAPLNPPMLRMFKVERKHPEECAASRADAFRQTLDFLRNW